MDSENETVEEVCSKLRSYEGEYQLKAFGVINREDKFLTDKILTAHKRELAAKDALIKELADALNSYLVGECIDCGKQCVFNDVCLHQVKYRALVAKAMEVVK